MDALELLNSLTTEELANTDTTFPNLAPGQYEFLIDTAEIKDNTAGTGKYLLFQCKLQSEGAKSTAGEPLAIGYPVRHMINLSPSQKQIDKNPEGLDGVIKNIKRDIAKFLEAVAGPSRTYDPSFAAYRGNTFWAKTRVSKERTDDNTGVTYDPQTEIASLIPKEVDVDIYSISAAYAEEVPF